MVIAAHASWFKLKGTQGSCKTQFSFIMEIIFIGIADNRIAKQAAAKCKKTFCSGLFCVIINAAFEIDVFSYRD